MESALSGEELFARLMLAIAAVIIAAGFTGGVAVRVGQPRVMGEVLAGILLGPTFLTTILPGAGSYLFPPQVVSALAAGADIGLAFYMFLVGLELDSQLLRGRLRQAALISNASVVVPMVLGFAIAGVLYGRFKGSDSSPLAFALFLGVSMSITAFPVLARILVERRMIRRPVGVVAMAAAAVDDATAWGLLALATAIVGATAVGGAGEGGAHAALRTVQVVALASLFVLFMVTVVRRLLHRLAAVVDELGHVPSPWLVLIFLGVLLSAATAGLIGVAPIFGAFVLGIVMPRREAMTRDVAHRLDDFVAIVLLPLFFVVAGLKTDVLKVISPDHVAVTFVLIIVAIAAKLLAAAAAARLSGASSRESLAIGALMNTRGLTELIVLNVAFEQRVINAELFTMLVLMALVTTFMARPLLTLIDPRGQLTAPDPGQLMNDGYPDPAHGAGARPVILAAALDGRNLPDLVAIARAVAMDEERPREIVAVRLLELAPVPTGIGELDRRLTDANRELRAVAANDGTSLQTAALTCTQPDRNLARMARPDRVDLVLVDGRRSLLGSGVLGGPVSSLLEEAPADVGILIRRGEAALAPGAEKPVIVPFDGTEQKRCGAPAGGIDRELPPCPAARFGSNGGVCGSEQRSDPGARDRHSGDRAASGRDHADSTHRRVRRRRHRPERRVPHGR